MTTENKLIKLTRNCKASLIPSGDQIELKKGEVVRITQSLGGSFTVLINGNLVRIEGCDSDAIGKKSKKETR